MNQLCGQKRNYVVICDKSFGCILEGYVFSQAVCPGMRGMCLFSFLLLCFPSLSLLIFTLLPFLSSFCTSILSPLSSFLSLLVTLSILFLLSSLSFLLFFPFHVVLPSVFSFCSFLSCHLFPLSSFSPCSLPPPSLLSFQLHAPYISPPRQFLPLPPWQQSSWQGAEGGAGWLGLRGLADSYSLKTAQ